MPTGLSLSLTPARRVRLLLEAALIYVVVPILFWSGVISIRLLHAGLFAGAAGVMILVCGDPKFERIRLWNVAGLRARRRTVVKLFGICAPLILLFMAAMVFARERHLFDVPPEVDWFSLPLHKPRVYLLVMIGYPLISVYPQELIYRTLFFERYAAAFGSLKAAIIANALVFGWAHIIFHNAVAVCLTVAGGALFSVTYIRTKSLLAAAFEHTLYGGLLFTIGLGWYFFGGSVQAMEKALHTLAP